MKKFLNYFFASSFLLTSMSGCGVPSTESPSAVTTNSATAAVTEPSDPSETPLVSRFDDGDFLVTEGTNFVTKDGKRVILQGFNLGGWLCHTVYMTPFSGDGVVDDTTLYAKLEERFGKERAGELLQTYFESNMTPYDFDLIAQTGANSVRLPFWWRNFMNEDGSFITDENGNPDFSLLDYAVEQCAARGIYVILELHGAPGSQNGMHASGLETENPTFFARNEEGERNRALTTKLWVEIAKHFKGNPAVAGLDLLGEPYWTGTILTDNRWWIWTYYNECYKAIREVDADRIVILESSWNAYDLPDPKLITEWKDVEWKYVAYSPHYYPNKNATTPEQVKQKFDERFQRDMAAINEWGVPLYIGETNWHTDWNMWDYALGTFVQEWVSYSVWAYKCPLDATTIWGVVWQGDVTKPDLNFMLYKEISNVWKLRSDECMTLNEKGIRMCCRHMGGDVEAFGFDPDEDPFAEVAASQVSLNKKTLTMKVGESVQLIATLSPENVEDQRLIWVSSNSNIVRVDSNGKVTAVAAGGPVYIAVKWAGNEAVKASVAITVEP